MPIKHPRLWTYSLPVALVLLAPFNILASLGMDIYLPIVPAMPAILGTTPEVVQLTLTLYMIMLGVGQIIFGPLSDRFGRRPILIGGVFVFAVTSLALAVTTSAWLFVFLRLVQAAGAAAMLVAVFATVRDVYADTPRKCGHLQLNERDVGFRSRVWADCRSLNCALFRLGRHIYCPLFLCTHSAPLRITKMA